MSDSLNTQLNVIGRVPSEIEIKCVAVAVLTNTKENVDAVQASKIQQLEWRRFGLVISVMITQDAIQEWPEIIEHAEKKECNYRGNVTNVL